MKRKQAVHLSVLVSVVMAVVMAAAACVADDTEASNAATPAADTMGAEVYAQNCASCHGVNLEGTDKGPSQLSIVYEPNHHNDDSYRSAIANGVPQHHWPFGDMPPVEGLSSDEVEAVIAFIRSEQERQGFQR